MFQRCFAAGLLVLIAVAAGPARADSAGDKRPGVSAVMKGDARRPPSATHWQRAELYFGLGTTESHSEDADRARWQRFMDEEITPRFPDGFSVLDAYGQWQRQDNRTIEHLNSKLVVILFHGREARHKLEALRAAWKQRTGDESVLLSITPAIVSF